MKDLLKKAAKLIVSEKPWVVLTGAGISTESGIPDFRTKNTGLWEQYDPMWVLSTDALLRRPEVFYGTGLRILMRFENARPNPAHQVLAEWEKRELVEAVITQNIDSLHQKAGSRKVLEIHGHLRSAHCMGCGSSYPMQEVENKVQKGEIPPRCSCGGQIRPDVVLFGDLLPPDFEKAQVLAHKFPMIVVGSSLTVSPANLLPRYARKLIIINLESTPYDQYAEIVLHGKAGEVLTALDAEVKKLMSLTQ
ncbi:MAG: NAD-dependent protein deacylase [Candidatus Atribacteria bacterium]|nr:NAD-dependent protein deacylase [Candidatus Atribacteria bacterium]MCD6350393.1 NAD-dependent protein deacylase [Candidatus Atribacteria bacterium]